MVPAGSFRGSERELRRFSGARAVRVSHVGLRRIDPHRHDWPNLTVYLTGAFTEHFEDGEIRIAGPSVIVHPAGSEHANDIAVEGLETFGVMFDPAWLTNTGFSAKYDRPLHWVGGSVSAAARHLASEWMRPGSTEKQLAAATNRFFEMAMSNAVPRRPTWLKSVSRDLELHDAEATQAIADRLNLNPAWLARAYRASTGEGMQETVRRQHIETAIRLLRSSSLQLAEVALQAGFCDQAHMNRCFRAVLGCTPRAIRSPHGRDLQG
jgi:AraC-like DNA-binding protein